MEELVCHSMSCFFPGLSVRAPLAHHHALSLAWSPEQRRSERQPSNCHPSPTKEREVHKVSSNRCDNARQHVIYGSVAQHDNCMTPPCPTPLGMLASRVRQEFDEYFRSGGYLPEERARSFAELQCWRGEASLRKWAAMTSWKTRKENGKGSKKAATRRFGQLAQDAVIDISGEDLAPMGGAAQKRLAKFQKALAKRPAAAIDLALACDRPAKAAAIVLT